MKLSVNDVTISRSHVLAYLAAGVVAGYVGDLRTLKNFGGFWVSRENRNERITDLLLITALWPVYVACEIVDLRDAALSKLEQDKLRANPNPRLS